MVVPPPPPSYPPPAWEGSEHSSSDSEADFDVDTKTPLMGQTGKRNKKDVFRQQQTLPTCYSSIEDASPNKSFGSNDDDEDLSRSTRSVTTVGTVTTVLENFRGTLMLPFTSDETSLPKIGAGMASLTCIGVILGLCMPKNPALHGIWSPWYKWLSSVIGYTYFVLWSVCFYPQVLLNIRRKSTRGLSNDFAVLNLLGWLFYSIYLSSMYFDNEIQSMYEERFKNESSTVQSNDVLFSIHATTLSFIYVVQIVYYGDQGCSLKLKPQTWFLLGAMLGPTVIMALLLWFGILAYSMWLDFFYMCSFFKICCTLTKYTKQVLLNWNRKSTSGWNIWYNFLECSGGALSMLQIVFDSLDMNDLTGITGNMAKFALGLATIFFDAIFFTQHYILYPEPPSDRAIDEIPTSIKANDRLILTFNSTDDTDTESYIS